MISSDQIDRVIEMDRQDLLDGIKKKYPFQWIVYQCKKGLAVDKDVFDKLAPQRKLDVFTECILEQIQNISSVVLDFIFGLDDFKMDWDERSVREMTYALVNAIKEKETLSPKIFQYLYKNLKLGKEIVSKLISYGDWRYNEWNHRLPLQFWDFILNCPNSSFLFYTFVHSVVRNAVSGGYNLAEFLPATYVEKIFEYFIKNDTPHHANTISILYMYYDKDLEKNMPRALKEFENDLTPTSLYKIINDFVYDREIQIPKYLWDRLTKDQKKKIAYEYSPGNTYETSVKQITKESFKHHFKTLL
jgi:hypothetical protein